MFSKAIIIAASTAITVMLAAGSAKAEMPGKLFVNQVSGKCLDVPGLLNTTPGTPLQLYDCETNGFDYSGKHSDQFWVVTQQGQIRNTLSAMCLDISGAENGAQIVVAACEPGNTAQNWTIRPDGLIQNAGTGKCIGVAPVAAFNNETPLVHADCENGNPQTTQRWRS